MSGAGDPAVGIYGGTFDPIHLGHLRAAEEVAELLGLERVVFVPSARPPHKPGNRVAPAALRLDWVRRAVADNPRFEASAIEIERDGPSYLVDTLRAFSEKLAPARPVFVLGRDAFCEMDEWREPRTLFTLAHFAVTTRPPQDEADLGQWLPSSAREDFELAPDGRSARHREAGTWLQLLEITALDVSASELRERLRDGRSVRYLLPESVQEAVVKSGAYANESTETGT